MSEYNHAEPNPSPDVLALLNNAHVQARLRGEPHKHHRNCIHNLTPSEQITLRGRTHDWWIRMGLPEPVQITPDDWEKGA